MQYPIKVVAREAFFIRKDQLDPVAIDALTERNRHYFFEEKVCADCEWNEQRLESKTRLGEACPTCAAFKGGVDLAKDVKVGANTYLSVPAGDRKGLKKILGDIEIKDKRKLHEFKRPIKFTGQLHDYQEEAVAAIRKSKYGVIKAPPRSGKTVLSTAAICRIGRKAIILASQRDWLDGFHETFLGSKTQKPLTNAKKSQVGFAKTLEDFEKYDVCLCTYQTFNSEEGQKLLAKLRDVFTVCFIDEVRLGAANKFASCVARLNVRYRIGLDGTPNRKDQRFVIVSALVGPIIYEAKVKKLRPAIRLVRTQYAKNYKGRVQWATMVNSLEKDPKRLKLIAEWAIKDAKDGHMVIIPLSRIDAIKALNTAINRIAGRKIAAEFHGQVPKPMRKQVIQDARTYKIKIIVGNTKLVSTGINIPRASNIYDVSMSANNENCEQRVSRILTPWDDKPPPMMRIFLDDMNVRRRCLSSEWWGCIKSKFKPLISDKDEKILKAYLNQKTGRGFGDWQL